MALVRKHPGSIIVIYFEVQSGGCKTDIRRRTLIFQDGWSSMLMASVTPSKAGMTVSGRDWTFSWRSLTVFGRRVESRSSHRLEADQ